MGAFGGFVRKMVTETPKGRPPPPLKFGFSVGGIYYVISARSNLEE